MPDEVDLPADACILFLGNIKCVLKVLLNIT